MKAADYIALYLERRQVTHVFELPGMPAGAQFYPQPGEFGGDAGVTLRLHVCGSCDLYQLNNEPVPYFRDVIRPSGTSPMIIEFRRKQLAEMVQRFGLTGRKVFECGCGQGEFLSLWMDFPVEACGIEHHAGFVAQARSKSLTVHQGYVGSATDKVPHGPFDAFTSFNFLEHQPDPNGMLRGIWHNLTERGGGLITVPNFDYILENNAYYELIIDHLLYFSRQSFTAILERNGFQVVCFDETLADTHCAFVAKKAVPDHSGLERARKQLDTKLADFVRAHQGGEGRIAVWGASHQGFTILSSAGIASALAFIIDSAQFKQGKFSPTSHLPIVPPDTLATEKMAAIIVIAPNYSEEIVRTIRQKYRVNCPVAIVRGGTVEIRG